MPEDESARQARERAEEKAQQARAVDVALRAFERESRDATSGDTERDLYAALEASPVPGASIQSLDCVPTMCRVVFATTGPEAQQTLAPHIATTEGFQTEMLFSYGEDGTGATVFVARPGRIIPKPPAP